MDTRTSVPVMLVLLLVLGPLRGQAQPLVDEEGGPVKARAFPLSQVQLQGGLFEAAQRRDVEYLLDLKPDRFLHNFRRFAGLKPKAPRYKGWESSTDRSE